MQWPSYHVCQLRSLLISYKGIQTIDLRKNNIGKMNGETCMQYVRSLAFSIISVLRLPHKKRVGKIP